ncbi:hypothetical protein PPGU19_015090 [Paraburkholderia sp. PGU19]|nr:hypothetical protein PPGU19_015090 [Paraburkholderia sp. PGU19]
MVRERGFVPDAYIDTCLAAGYTRQNALEIILGWRQVMSNYTNHIVHIEYVSGIGLESDADGFFDKKRCRAQ